MLAENLPGAIAQSTQNNDLPSNLAAGFAGSVIGRGLLSAGGRTAGAIRNATQREAQAGAATVPGEQTTTAVVPPEQGVQDVAARVGAAADRETASRMADAARDVAPRQDVIDAAKQLGLREDDLLLSHVSGNQAYRDFEQALKSVPGSQLAAQENQALTKIAKQATDLTDAAGALPDKAAMNDKFCLRSSAALPLFRTNLTSSITRSPLLSPRGRLSKPITSFAILTARRTNWAVLNIYQRWKSGSITRCPCWL